MTALHHANPLRRGMRTAARCILAPSLLALGACANSPDTPSAAWLLAATARALAGAPPTPDFHLKPVRVSDALRFTAIAAGGEHTCALTVDGDTYCWGSNRYEQLGPTAAVTGTCGEGPGAFSCSWEPVRLRDAPRFVALAAARWTTCGLDASGAAHCWGYGLGGGRTEQGLPASSGVPVAVPGGRVFSALASSPSSNGRFCGLDADGRAWCWGLSLGEGAESGVFVGPDPVPGNVQLAAIAWGGHHGCGLDASGVAYCWGSNESGSLGTGASGHQGGVRESAEPVRVQGGLALREVVAGAGYSCGVSTAGSAHCWGLGFPTDGASPRFARLSPGPLPHGALPVALDLRGAQWVGMSAAGVQACGLAADGAAYCFSVLPVQGAHRRPARVDSDRTFVALAVGNGHACALDAEAFAYCWGDGSAGRVGRQPSGRPW